MLVFVLLFLGCRPYTACDDMNDGAAYCGVPVAVDCRAVSNPDDPTFACAADALWSDCDAEALERCSGGTSSSTTTDTGTSYTYR